MYLVLVPLHFAGDGGGVSVIVLHKERNGARASCLEVCGAGMTVSHFAVTLLIPTTVLCPGSVAGAR